MPKERNLMQRTIDKLREIALHDIQSAHGEAHPDCRPTVDTRSPGYYTHCVLGDESEYGQKVADLKAEIRAVEADPERDECYLGHLKTELWWATAGWPYPKTQSY